MTQEELRKIAKDRANLFYKQKLPRVVKDARNPTPSATAYPKPFTTQPPSHALPLPKFRAAKGKNVLFTKICRCFDPPVFYLGRASETTVSYLTASHLHMPGPFLTQEDAIEYFYWVKENHPKFTPTLVVRKLVP